MIFWGGPTHDKHGDQISSCGVKLNLVAEFSQRLPKRLVHLSVGVRRGTVNTCVSEIEPALSVAYVSKPCVKVAVK